jgi:hypothetical protein
MKLSSVKEAIKIAVKAEQPTMLWGPPGVGKSMIHYQIAKDLYPDEENPIRECRLPNLDLVDLYGLPYINGGNRSHWAPPEFLPREGHGIFFLDEIVQGSQAMQNCVSQLVLDRRLGDYHLPKGWAICAAGNRMSDRAATSKMPRHIEGRFAHLEVDVDLDDWIKWALANGIRTELIGFLRLRPELLHSWDPKSADHAQSTPRTIEFLSNLMNQNPSKDIEFELYKGTVGEGFTSEFMGFLRVFRTLPNPDTILLTPDTSEVPTDPATLYAIAGALARKATTNTIDRLVRYFNRMPTEFGILAVMDSLRLNPEIMETRVMMEWVSNNSEVIL